MCVPSLNEIRESIFELSRTQVKTYGGGGATDLKPIYPRLSSGDIIMGFVLNLDTVNIWEIMKSVWAVTHFCTIFYKLRQKHALPYQFNEKETNQC